MLSLLQRYLLVRSKLEISEHWSFIDHWPLTIDHASHSSSGWSSQHPRGGSVEPGPGTAAGVQGETGWPGGKPASRPRVGQVDWSHGGEYRSRAVEKEVSQRLSCAGRSEAVWAALQEECQVEEGAECGGDIELETAPGYQRFLSWRVSLLWRAKLPSLADSFWLRRCKR